jgi:hypothetical protein
VTALLWTLVLVGIIGLYMLNRVGEDLHKIQEQLERIRRLLNRND